MDIVSGAGHDKEDVIAGANVLFQAILAQAA